MRLPSKASAGDLSSLSYKNTEKYKDTNLHKKNIQIEKNTNTDTKKMIECVLLQKQAQVTAPLFPTKIQKNTKIQIQVKKHSTR